MKRIELCKLKVAKGKQLIIILAKLSNEALILKKIFCKFNCNFKPEKMV